MKMERIAVQAMAHFQSSPVGLMLAWLINDRAQVVDWVWDSTDAPDNVFRELALLNDGHQGCGKKVRLPAISNTVNVASGTNA